ncbi:MAG: peptide ABC transporter substrate-binding protein [Phototrophicaceae bacterium]
MRSGFRWQLLALIISIILFGVVLGFRFLDTPQEDLSTTQSPTIAPTITQVAPTFTPEPTQVALAEDISVADDSVIFTEGIVGSIQRLNPLLITNQAERDITSLIYEGLADINEFGEPAPDLAESWVVSRDGYEYVVQLRQDILWQDGMAFTADDVVFTYNLLASPDLPFAEISSFWQTVEIEKLNDYLIRFRLAQPLASFPTLLTIGILPEHALTGTTASQLLNHPFNLNPVGTGAYQLEGLRSSNGQQIEFVDLQVAPNYRLRPEGQEGYALSHLRFRLFSSFDSAITAFISGDIHSLASRSMDERFDLLTLASAESFAQTEPTVGMLIFNWNEGEETRFFTDLRVRNALQVSLNRSNPVASILNNRAVIADSPLHPDSWAYNNTYSYPNTDPNRAFSLFENATITVPEDTDLGDFLYRFSILTPDNPDLVAIAQNIASQWGQYNLDVTVEAVSSEVYQERLVSGEFDTAIVEYVLGADPDVFAYWHADQYPSGLNYGAVSDSRVSEILERGRQTVSNLSRIEIYRDFQAQFINQVIALPLYYPLYTYSVDKDVVGVQLGFISSPEDRFRNLQDWSFSN